MYEIPHQHTDEINLLLCSLPLASCLLLVILSSILPPLLLFPPPVLSPISCVQLLGDFLAPVTDQVPDRVLDYSVLLSSRVQVKSAGMQRDAHTPATSAAPRAHSRQTAPMGAPRVRPVSLALCISLSLALTQAGMQTFAPA